MPEPTSRVPAPGSLSVERGHLPPELAGLPASILEALAARAAMPDAPWVIGNGFRLSFGEADARTGLLYSLTSGAAAVVGHPGTPRPLRGP